MDNCWLWAISKDRGGYGRITVKGVKQVRAHRAIYEALVGEIPKGMHVLHKCDTPPCINPEHLFLGTAFDNMQDMTRKGRNHAYHAGWTHCKRGHPFNERNTTVRLNGKRECRTCNNARNKLYKQSKDKNALDAPDAQLEGSDGK